jgi:Domain of unknown function (DUF4430)
VADAPDRAGLTRARRSAVAVALLLGAALAAAGCGLGAGRGLGDASLTVTRDFGARALSPPVTDGVTEADTVMRVLERNADVETRYGGGFVQSIDGLEGDDGAAGGPEDWFFYVDGVESPVGAAQYPLHGGEAIWWDYHRWPAAMRVPAVVGSWPRPLRGGYQGGAHPVALLCRGAAAPCGTVRRRLKGAGVSPVAGRPRGAIRVLVGPWSRLRRDPAVAPLERGPDASGVYAEFAGGRGCRLEGLDEGGANARDLGAEAGLVAATRRYEDPPTWIVTGCRRAGVEAAARLLDREQLRDRFAVASAPAGAPLPLPLPGS